MQKLNGIQWLRGFAAIMVVMFHAASRWKYGFEIGECGVDIFFVISGFIMWSVASSPVSPLSFLRDRIARVVPIYWFAIGLMALGGLIGIFPHVIVNASNVAKSLFFIPYVGDGSHAWPLLVQGWTLNYEMFFYLIFSLFIKFPNKIRLGLLIGVLAMFVAVGSAVRPENIVLKFYSDPIILEFAVGAVIGQYFTQGTVNRGLAVAAVILGGIFFVADSSGNFQMMRLLRLGIPASLIVSGAIAIEKSGISFGYRPLIFLGDASYSIYLFHTFAISIVARLLPSPMAGASPALATVFGVGVGCAVYKILEKPLARKLRRKKHVPDALEVTAAVLGNEVFIHHQANQKCIS